MKNFNKILLRICMFSLTSIAFAQKTDKPFQK